MLVAVGVVQSLAMLMFLFMGGGEGPKSSSGGETTNSLSVRDRPNKIPEARDLKPAVNKESRDRMCAVLNAGVGCNVTMRDFVEPPAWVSNDKSLEHRPPCVASR